MESSARSQSTQPYRPQPSIEHSYRPDLQTESSLASALVRHLAELGVERAFGVIGGAIGVLFDALEESVIETHHFRHETGAAFAATEAYFASGKPTLVFTTTGPGMLNALTGITAARWEGAKVILVSGSTSAPQRGRWATQESSSYTLPQDALFGRGPIFDYALRMESPSELPEVIRRLALGLARPGGFVAHLGLPISLQSSRVEAPKVPCRARLSSPAVAPEDVEHCAELLQEDEDLVVWLGFGARGSAPAIRALVERTNARVMSSPRGKGIFPEDHPNYLGVTGLGGHQEVLEQLRERRPRWILVLGSRLGEATSFWDRDLTPAEGFIHVDLDPEVPGVAFPDCRTYGIQAEIGGFLEALLPRLPEREDNVTPLPVRHAAGLELPCCQDPVRPQALMEAIQRRVVQGSDALVMAECGNAFAWCSHYLRFPKPGRYRVSTLYGSMGHCAAGVVGAALTRGKTVAVVGDGSMLMNSEISTAVQYHAPAVWVVLNDGGYGMCESGQEVLGLATGQLAFPEVDFVKLARAMGADGIQVRSEDMLDVALEKALVASGPYVLDVRIDASQISPLMHRFESLLKQGSSKNVAGWEV
ncbi:MAG: thiamine pyrophosphate-binding protein [Acidobacteria bacterium]|nr:MAG: thiamine pyrophosphate-binding protein [Acidobacteriota bacterium]